MPIRIQRNENANAITFVGSSQPAYWNACLEGEVNEDDSTRVNVVNTVRTTDADNKVFEFFAVPFMEFQTSLGTSFANAQECADYITAQANATAIGILEFGATDVVDFQRDATNTTILVSTGHSYPVNSIKAVAKADGTITIRENVDSGADLMRFIRKANVTFGGQTQAQQLAPVVNACNSLFTVTPVGGGAEDRFVSNSYTTRTPATTVFGDVIKTISGGQPIALKGTNTSSEFNDGFFTTSHPISANGEYFQFDNSGHDPLKKMMIGLMLTSEVSVAALEDNTVTGEDMDLAVRLKPNATYEHSPYGAVIESGMFENPQRSDEYRAGIDDDGRLFISHYNDSASEWQVIVRSALVTANEEYSLVVFLKQENAACSYVITGKEIYSGPTMTYYYIESPDGSFYYPLFSTEEEANQADTNNGGSGASHQHTFADETPTSQIWYMPSTGGTHAGSSAPSNTADITYNVIATGADANYAPAAFTINDLSVNENTAVNYQVAPAGASWTTTVSGLPLNLTLSGDNIVGTTQDIAGYADTTPSVVSTVTVTRTNTFGSTSSTFDITIVNTAAPATAITGFTHITGSTNLIDSDTLDDGSAVTLDDTVEDGKRLKITDAWITANVLANLSENEDKIFIGFSPTPTSGWSGITVGDFNCGFRFQYNSATSVRITPMLGGTSMGSTVIHAYSSNLGYDFYISNKGGVCEANYHSSTTDKSTEPTAADGGTWDYTATQDTSVTESKTVVIGTSATTADISLSGISEHTLPTPSTIVTDWTKALDFSGSNEHLKQVSSSMYSQPLQMNGLANTVDLGTVSQGDTSNHTSARPWATAVVFKSDGNNSNQIIWNQGEGSSSGNDNIYLRLSAAGSLFFGWGREGSGYNECRLANQNISTSNWYGVSVAHSGVRLGGNAATAANLADCFDIRIMSSADSFGSLSSNLSTSANWTSSGNRMDRTVAGDFTVGGRGSNKSFHGKIASMVVTTLLQQYYSIAQMPEGTMVGADQAKMMITDPIQWVDNYKVRLGSGNPNGLFRKSAERFATNYFTFANAYQHTHVWLMGDGTSDSYANGVRNYINPSDQNFVKMQLNSMVSNDIETVNIPGLT